MRPACRSSRLTDRPQSAARYQHDFADRVRRRGARRLHLHRPSTTRSATHVWSRTPVPPVLDEHEPDRGRVFVEDPRRSSLRSVLRHRDGDALSSRVITSELPSLAIPHGLARALGTSRVSLVPRLSMRTWTWGHHPRDCRAHRRPVKALRAAPTPLGAHGLDSPSVEPHGGIQVMTPQTTHVFATFTVAHFTERRIAMRQLSITPNITVTIGRHTRLYFAFVTTAPAEFDSPATLTLHAGPFADVVSFAADAFVHDEVRARTPARLILVDALELAWQHARCRGHQHLLLPAGRVLVGPDTLQQWLWQRLQTPTSAAAHA